jgi:radical SAM protein with 4Fe4S-binding SPASM domain
MKESFIRRLRKYLSRRLDPGKSSDDANKLEIKLQRVRLALEERLTEKTTFLPRIVHLETRSRCNGKCTFCLASTATDPRADVLMPDVLIDKIIDELHDLDFANRLSLYNNNEPLMDKRIFAITAKARQRLPKAYIEIKTNGMSLNLEKVLKLFNAGLDALYVNDYRPSAEVDAGRYRPNISKLMAELADIRRFKGGYGGGRYHDRIIFNLRREDERLSNRAGTAPNADKIPEPLKAPCLRPFEMVTINPNGVVSLCSDDMLSASDMGNVGQQSLHDIWTSPAYDKVRRSLLNADRSCKAICNVCNSRGFSWEIFREMGY